jgi:hypothetical protein
VAIALSPPMDALVKPEHDNVSAHSRFNPTRGRG